MQDFLEELAALSTAAGWLALANIVVIDVVMSGDNAILIGMAVRKLQGKQRRHAIVFGVAFATALRVALAAAATYLLGVTGIMLAGALLLLYVVWKFYRELRSPHSPAVSGAAAASGGLAAAVWTIVAADVSMSLDNVLAVAGASHGNIAALAIGLAVSILLMAFASNFVARSLDRHPWIQWVGLVVILFVAVDMLLSGADQVSVKVGAPVLPAVVLGSCLAFSFLHAKFVKPAGEAALRARLGPRYLYALTAAVAILSVLLVAVVSATSWFVAHAAVPYVALFALLTALLELLALARRR